MRLPGRTAPSLVDEAIEVPNSVPGIDVAAAQAIAAEIGTDMRQFPTPAHLGSWAGMSPGNNESAGKRRSGKTTKGNRWLRRTLVQAALAAGRTQGTYLSAQYHRLSPRRGKKRAAVAVALSMLVSIHCMFSNHVFCSDLGADFSRRLLRQTRPTTSSPILHKTHSGLGLQYIS